MTSLISTAIKDKIVETLSLNGVTSENKTFLTPPPLPSLKVEVFFLQVAQTVVQHRMEGIGEGKIYSLFFKLAKCWCLT